MPRYRANTKLLLAHESRLVEAGDEFTTTFPKVLVKGKKVDMKLGDNITLLGGDEAEAQGDAGQPEDTGAQDDSGADTGSDKPAKRTPDIQD